MESDLLQVVLNHKSEQSAIIFSHISHFPVSQNPSNNLGKVRRERPSCYLFLNVDQEPGTEKASELAEIKVHMSDVKRTGAFPNVGPAGWLPPRRGARERVVLPSVRL